MADASGQGSSPSPNRQPASMAWLFFSPSGRIGRKTYTLAVLFWVCVTAMAVQGTTAAPEASASETLFALAGLTILLAGSVSLIMLAIKRFHDLGYPAMLAILLFVPILSLIVLLFLVVFPSQPQPNPYGDITDAPKS